MYLRRDTYCTPDTRALQLGVGFVGTVNRILHSSAEYQFADVWGASTVISAPHADTIKQATLSDCLTTIVLMERKEYSASQLAFIALGCK